MKKPWVIHPFLFAIFPILFLFAYNIDEVPPGDIILPLLAAIIATIILVILARLVSGSFVKGGLIASYFLFLFFSFGHVRDMLSSIGLNNFVIAGSFFQNQFILGPLWAVLFTGGAILVLRAKCDFSMSTRFLNIMAIALIALSLVNIAIPTIRTANYGTDKMTEEPAALIAGNPGNLPDIYYIILDGYARQDTLEELFGYDNGEFITYLTGKGFYVATRSRSKVCDTKQSMPLSLNMGYLTSERSPENVSLISLWVDNEVARFLRERGYSYSYIGGNLDLRGMKRYTDNYYAYKSGNILRTTDFAHELIRTTALWPFLRFFRAFLGDHDRQSVLYAFDKLAEIPSIKEPTFVYAHILCPHFPFVFDRDGNLPEHNIIQTKGWVWDPEDDFMANAYLDQLIFATKKVQAVIDEIITASDIPPIIILQSDHGVGHIVQEHGFRILNAYYLPGKDTRLLYETISPVNSFRIVFNLYFDTDYELLEDVSK